MKAITLNISILFLLVGCKKPFSGPDFKVGDCMAMQSDVKRSKEPLERWETSPEPYTVELIVEVGKEKYLTVADFSGFLRQSDSKISYDGIMTKVECTDNLKQVKKELFK